MNSEYSFFNSRAQICVYQRYKNLKSIQCIAWRCISRIIFFNDEAATCSICLSKPKFPRIDKCGHIFCLICLINLFKHHGTEFVLCPLCKNYELQLSNTKRVKIIKSQTPKVNDRLKLNLLVKSNKNLVARQAYKIVYEVNNSVPQSLNNNINYGYVCYDSDMQMERYLESDLHALNGLKRFVISTNGEDIYQETSQFLHKELHNFGSFHKSEGQYDNFKQCNGEKFNLLRLDKYNSKFDMFFQCPYKKYVFLDKGDCKDLIKLYCDLERPPPISVIGNVIEVNEVAVDNGMIESTHFRHLPTGAKLYWVKLDMIKAEFEFLFGDHLKKLRNCKLNDIREERKMQRIHEQMSLSKAGLEPVSRTNQIVERPTAHAPNQLNRLHRLGEVWGFNSCTLGIECVAPDDDYPHATDCLHYKPVRNQDTETTSIQSLSSDSMSCQSKSPCISISSSPSTLDSSSSSSNSRHSNISDIDIDSTIVDITQDDDSDVVPIDPPESHNTSNEINIDNTPSTSISSIFIGTTIEIRATHKRAMTLSSSSSSRPLIGCIPDMEALSLFDTTTTSSASTLTNNRFAQKYFVPSKIGTQRQAKLERKQRKRN